MTLTEVGSFLVVVGGVAGGAFAGFRAFRSDKSSQKAKAEALMVSNFQTLYDEQKEQLKELKEEVKRIKQDQTEERRQWADERRSLQAIVERKDKVIDDLRKGMTDLQRQIDRNVRNQNAVNKENSKP